MKRHFIVGAKLLGLYFLCEGIVSAAYFLTAAAGHGLKGTMSGLVAAFVINSLSHFVVGLVLLFFTNTIAHLVGIWEQPANEASISYESALEIGIILIGMLKFVSFVPMVASELQNALGQFPSAVRPIEAGQIAGLVVSLVLIFAARPVARVMMRVGRSFSPSE
jgi:hypothetical protein